VEHAPESKDVAAPIRGKTSGLFWRHISGGAKYHPRICRGETIHECRRVRKRGVAGIGMHRLRATKIQNFYFSFRTAFDVGRLQIAMDNSLLMRGFQRIANGCRDVESIFDGDRTTSDTIGEGVAVDQFKYEKT